jgi:type IV pilus assembly protein PilX
VALLFLVILAMLGVSSMTGTTLEERMSGNARDQNVAMQAAEAALRDAEQDVTSPAARVTVAKFVAACTAALCTEGAALANLDDVLKSAFYGQFTGELAIQNLPQQPRYMVELLNAPPPQIPLPPAGQSIRNFRITAKGYGQNPNTIVILQTVFQVTL